MPNQIVNPGFGWGQCFGVPVTVGVAPSTTLAITSNVPVGKYWVTGLATGVSLAIFSTTAASIYTGSLTLASGATIPYVFHDGSGSLIAANTTTSVSLVFIKAP